MSSAMRLLYYFQNGGYPNQIPRIVSVSKTETKEKDFFSDIPKKYRKFIGLQNPMFINDMYYLVVEGLDLYAKDLGTMKKLLKSYFRYKKQGWNFTINKKTAEIKKLNYCFILNNCDITQYLKKIKEIEKYEKQLRKNIPDSILSFSENYYKISYKNTVLYHKDLNTLKFIFKKLCKYLQRKISITQNSDFFLAEINKNNLKFSKKEIKSFLKNYNKTNSVQFQLNY